MKLLIDAQLPRRLAHQLRAAGFETIHTLDLPDGNRTTDQTLITFSLTEQCVVVTKDSDFVESFLLKREPWKLLLVSNEQSAQVAVFRIDTDTGKLTPTTTALALDRPMCVKCVETH